MKNLTPGSLCVALVAVLAACTAKDERPQQPAAASGPNVVSLSATEYAIQAPDSIPAGWTTFRMANHGGEIRQVSVR